MFVGVNHYLQANIIVDNNEKKKKKDSEYFLVCYTWSYNL
jgi:hypothetical protein